VGGVGGAKLAYGLAQVVPPEDLTIIVNTGDDFELNGLRICPDLDTIMYTLSGLVDKTNGWGIADDTTHMLKALQRYGEDTWFKLGDQDLATHLLRSQWLREGCTLTEVTRRLTEGLGIAPTILPMSDTLVATMVDTVEHGELAFQTYFVKLRWQPKVKSLRFEGIEKAEMTREVSNALTEAEAIIIGPSNPWLSIAPILAVRGMRDAMSSRDVPRVAVTPIIEGMAVKGPAAKLMGELGYNQSAQGVVDYYGEVINGFVYDQRDARLNIQGLHTLIVNTYMQTETDRTTLARNILDWIGGW
jgi:LPPG:FO 2-phospho-L-lactate transferase